MGFLHVFLVLLLLGSQLGDLRSLLYWSSHDVSGGVSDFGYGQLQAVAIQ